MTPIPKHRRRVFSGHRHAGFTLAETLIVVAIFSVLGLAVYHSISGGVAIWQRGQRYVVEEDVSIFFDKLEEDLGNSIKYSLFPVEGGTGSIMFPTRVRTRKDIKKSAGRIEYEIQIGMVEYRYGPSKKAVLRRQANYGQAVEGDWGSEAALVKEIKDLSLRYLLYDEDKMDWEARTDGDLPAAVEATVVISGPGRSERALTRVIPVPLGMTDE